MRSLRNSHGRSIISQHWSTTRSTGRVSPLMATSGTWIMNFYLETYVACSLTSFYLRILPFGVAFRKILMFPKNGTVDGLVIHLQAYDSANLPQGRSIIANFKLSLINQRISTLTKTIGIIFLLIYFFIIFSLWIICVCYHLADLVALFWALFLWVDDHKSVLIVTLLVYYWYWL